MIIKKGELPSSKKDYYNYIKSINTKLKKNTEFQNLLIKAREGDETAKILSAEKQADAFLEQLGNLVEYIQYE